MRPALWPDVTWATRSIRWIGVDGDDVLIALVYVSGHGLFTFLTETPPGQDPDEEGMKIVAFSHGWPDNPLFTHQWHPIDELGS